MEGGEEVSRVFREMEWICHPSSAISFPLVPRNARLRPSFDLYTRYTRIWRIDQCVFDDKDSTRKGKGRGEREREWEGPNFMQRRASPRNLLPSKLQRGILPSPKDPAYLDEHGLLFPRRVFDRCLPGIKAVNGGGSAGYPPWRGWKVIGRDEGRCLRASSSEIIFERWNFVVDKTISKGFSIVGSLWGINLGLIYYRFVIDS